MINGAVLNPATTNGFVFKKPIDPVLEEKIVLKIVADHNDGDYITEFTNINVNKINLDLFFKVIKVMLKLVQADVYSGNETSWHIIDLYNKLTEEDIKTLHAFDKSRLPENHEIYSDNIKDINDLEEYSLMDLSPWADYSAIRDWFPCPDWDSEDSDHIKSNHSLISVTMQYHDGKGNILNIEPEG